MALPLINMIGISRQFGFLRFYDIDTSTTFMRHNYPAIYLHGKDANGNSEQKVKIRIAFSRERDSQRNNGDEWKCGNVSNAKHQKSFYLVLICAP